MIRQARVVGIEPATGKVAVALDDTSECIRCQRGEGCGQGMGAGLLSLNQARVQPQLSCLSEIELNEIDVSTHRQVLVDVGERGSGWLWPVFGAYGLPLAGMILATAVLSSVSTPAWAELLALFGAIGGLFAGIWAWRCISSRVLTSVERSLCLQSARIVGVVPSANREPR